MYVAIAFEKKKLKRFKIVNIFVDTKFQLLRSKKNEKFS